MHKKNNRLHDLYPEIRNIMTQLESILEINGVGTFAEDERKSI
jgi:hypothetical protein